MFTGKNKYPVRISRDTGICYWPIVILTTSLISYLTFWMDFIFVLIGATKIKFKDYLVETEMFRPPRLVHIQMSPHTSSGPSVDGAACPVAAVHILISIPSVPFIVGALCWGLHLL